MLHFEANGMLSRTRILEASDRRLGQSVAVAILNSLPFAPVPPEAACLIGRPIRTTFRNPAD